MHAFTLPDPPVGEDEKAAIQASLRLLDVADDLLSVPLFAAVYRAPLGDFGMTLFLSGSTGIFKTATAKLAQQHYGRDFENEENILHFDNGTANGFRESLFAAKDAVCLNRQRVICILAESFAKAEAGNDERPENAASTESAAIPPRSVPS
jgi:hypothetical protein